MGPRVTSANSSFPGVPPGVSGQNSGGFSRDKRSLDLLDKGGRGGPDKRPDVERRKGGVKLFVGRVPQEASEALLRKTFERFGNVLEVFKMRGEKPGEERHSLYHEDGLTCAFVRLKELSSAEEAIRDLHDKEILLKNRRDTGPIQVAF